MANLKATWKNLHLRLNKIMPHQWNSSISSAKALKSNHKLHAPIKSKQCLNVNKDVNIIMCVGSFIITIVSLQYILRKNLSNEVNFNNKFGPIMIFVFLVSVLALKILQSIKISLCCKPNSPRNVFSQIASFIVFCYHMLWFCSR